MLNQFTRNVAATLGRHFVTLSCQQHLPPSDRPNTLVFSGFVVAILGEWFYVTAGHVLHDIHAATQAGALFDAWRLGDHTAGNTFKGAAVPYDFDMDRWLVLDNRDTGLDYAIVHIHGLVRLQLEAGGVIAIDKEAWSDHATAYDHWALVGVPSESVAYDGATVINARVVLVPMVATDPPATAGVKASNQFYARPSEPSDAFFKEPDGFSGAPVFSLVYREERWLYNVIGVQSSWYPESGTLAACPFSTFAKEIEEVVAEALEVHAAQVRSTTGAA